MLALCTALYHNGAVGFDGFLIPLVALMSSFGPVTALASLGTTLQATVASGARVLAVIDEEPETNEGYVTLVNAKVGANGEITETEEIEDEDDTEEENLEAEEMEFEKESDDE